MKRRIILPNWMKNLSGDLRHAENEILSLKDEVERLKKERSLTNTPKYELDSQVYTIERPITPSIRPSSNQKIKPRKSLPTLNPTNVIKKRY